MAHYTLITSPQNEKQGWRSCAVLQASSLEDAGYQYKALRNAGGLAFVPRPARFRVRRATRGEVRLMMAFFHSFGGLGMVLGSDAERASFFARRRKLLLSFFMGLYIDPEAMRRRYVAGGIFDTGGSGASGSGGVETEEVSTQHAHKAPEVDIEAVAKDVLGPVEQDVLAGPDLTVESDEGSSFEGAGDDAIDESNQEAALAAILASPEANDGGKSRDESFDLGIL